MDKCHFIMDLDNGRETILEPNYSRKSNRFTVIKSAKFLDTSRYLFINMKIKSLCTKFMINIKNFQIASTVPIFLHSI